MKGTTVFQAKSCQYSQTDWAPKSLSTANLVTNLLTKTGLV